MRLYSYWRSSASYRVRIALNLKGIPFETVATNLRNGSNRTLDFLGKNPQGLVPVLEEGDIRLTQSLAIIECLEDLKPEPALLPANPIERARVRALAQLIACEIHPLNNVRVLNHLRARMGLNDGDVNSWYRHWIAEGLTALETQLKDYAGRYAFGDRVTLADVCLVPQLYNARRYNCDLKPYPTTLRVEEACLALAAFDDAQPERQPDAV
ncbi:MAG: maleylacetoacetate isomerase [Geminicoccaceae bacterium]